MTNQKLVLGDSSDASIIKELIASGDIKIGSVHSFEHFRDGKLIDSWSEHNLCTDEGLTHMLDVVFSGGTAIGTWYVIVFEDNFTPVAGSTYASPGFTESTAYTEANRQAWVEAGVAAKSITNSASKATLSINATKTIYGSALVGGGSAASTKDDQAGGGTLFNVVRFTSGSKSVENGDTLKVTITLTASDI